ncbi:hypothetical protein CHS0354_015018 [Potamilus streckersoni]|uniref:Tetraspanin n=1 Tax=Potamilus streckersoni TaxID=2493646 RepID=A0AAE0SMF3_9BIVA|nr:hypothetical protein CHS0354_015018 [Potamilus streckersoni]
MALSCGGKCSMFFLILINTTFMLFGIGLLVIGIIMRVNAGVLVGTEIMKLLNNVSFNGVTLATLVSSLSTFSICLGCFIIVEAGLGAFGACCKVRFMLIVYAVIIGLLLLAEIAVVALWAAMKEKVDSAVKTAMISVLNLYAGPSATDEISIGWNLLFIGMECCGVLGPAVSYSEFKNTKWSQGTSTIPYSCCNEATVNNFANGTNKQCEEMSSNEYRTTGCFDAIYSWFSQYTTPAIVIAVFILVIEIIGIIFAVVLFRGIKEEEEDKIV